MYRYVGGVWRRTTAGKQRTCGSVSSRSARNPAGSLPAHANSSSSLSSSTAQNSPSALAGRASKVTRPSFVLAE